MAYATPVLVVPDTARTTSGDSGALQVAEPGQKLSLLLSCGTVSGTTPSMTLSVEWLQGSIVFAPAEPPDTHGAAITVATNRVKIYDVKGPFYRIVWTITGTTPSFTFNVRAYVT